MWHLIFTFVLVWIVSVDQKRLLAVFLTTTNWLLSLWVKIKCRTWQPLPSDPRFSILFLLAWRSPLQSLTVHINMCPHLTHSQTSLLLQQRGWGAFMNILCYAYCIYIFMHGIYTNACYVLMYNLCISSTVTTLFSLLLKKNSKELYLSRVQDSELWALNLFYGHIMTTNLLLNWLWIPTAIHIQTLFYENLKLGNCSHWHKTCCNTKPKVTKS